ncbi:MULTISPECIES: DUF2232 domain-containing protein [unclassified Leptolyngbya]|uniref:DUF2232 domain-containing protein n=1 Tax=unclassified Leptolyngbya TaxID=2650499 RepID=UPI0016892BFC|nr:MULTISPECIES: DUF2232 domain-containing protein [unclassified Leptolyngbya]MBD1911483.1 DUF2232 domain-containing protein [Leptolyngbya sp. FACHB-8]MBD2155278.1 DUF2232 domain-containing protein [Leptolyngbya sp. FACHB-16]
MHDFPDEPSATPSSRPEENQRRFSSGGSLEEWEAVEAELARPIHSYEPIQGQRASAPPLALVETAFLASTTGLLWLASYYLSLVPWMRVVFPLPLALVYLRWGSRAAWMGLTVTALLLSILMGPYLSVLFLVPYGLLGVQLGATWKHRMGWTGSITTGTLLSTLSFFFRVWLLSVFVGEDLWVYLTSRIADLAQWIVARLVDWGILGVGALGQVDLVWVQALTIGTVLLSDLIYLFTVHLAAWLLLQRLGNPIPDPPEWVQVIFDEE